MRILILGGNRYFGLEVLKKLLVEGCQIYLINRCTKEKKKFLHKNLKYICCDRKNLKRKRYLFQNLFFDTVFDNIAYKVKDVKNLINLLEGRFNHYIVTSSAISYLDKNLRSVAKENDWKNGKDSVIFKKKYNHQEIQYAINKRKIEKYLIGNNKILTTIIRIPNVIGKNDFSSKTQKLINFKYELINDEKFGDQFIQFVFKNDLVNIILKIIKSKPKKTEAFNIANKKIKIKDFYYKTLKILKTNTKRNLPVLKEKFPLPTNSLIDCKKIQKKFRIKFTHIDKILKSIQKI